MKTDIKKMGDTIIVSMEGKLDFETAIPLRENLGKLSKQHRTDSTAKKIIFDLENLEFVGSSGISSFIQTLREFNSTACLKPRYCNVKNEFQKVIRAFDEEERFEFHETQDKARKSFDQ
ncbi:STAS domain-containing protein [Bdellovibrionota bacterium FG-2]